MQLKNLVLILAHGLVLACAPSLRSASAPDEVIFREGEYAERYDFKEGGADMGSHAGWVLEDCSSNRFHCVVGITVLIAPRTCAFADRLLRGRGAWDVNRKVKARFLFQAAPDHYYFSSDHADRERYLEGSDGFVYHPRRGIVGVWFSATVVLPASDVAVREEIIKNARVIDPGQTLFACRQ